MGQGLGVDLGLTLGSTGAFDGGAGQNIQVLDLLGQLAKSLNTIKQAQTAQQTHQSAALNQSIMQLLGS